MVINLVRDFSPVEALSTGRSISWESLGMAFLQIVIVLGGLLAICGIAVFNKRELAAAQSNN
jgi:hypothetical protein